MHKIRKTVGIDLGTTNSVIALLDSTDSRIITGQDAQGRKTFPSVVGYLADEQRPVVGHAAFAIKGGKAVTAVAPVSSIKRFMGLNRSFHVGPDTLTPTEISARVLQLLRDMLARTLNDNSYQLDSAIITMPAYFNHNQIEDTREAGELAGFEVVELLHEPTAAAIYYGWLENQGDATYLVYDLGGGTFDVSVIRKRFGDYEVLSVSGDPFLGGDDFDRLLASAVASGQWPVASDLGANFPRVVHVAEQIKIDLSKLERVDDVAERLEAAGLALATSHWPLATIHRGDFNRLVKDKVDRTIDCCQEALARARDKAGIRLADIDYVVLVGGSSRIPLVRETVRAAFCNPSLSEHVRCPEPLLSEPDLCVAYGAALRAATYGTRHLFPNLQRARSFLPDLDLGLGLEEPGLDLELHITSPVNVQETKYTLIGCVRGAGAAEVRHGGSVCATVLGTGENAEAILQPDGGFSRELVLQPETDNLLELTLCDNAGRDLIRLPLTVRHRAAARALGPAVLATQLVTKPLAIEVLNRQRQRVKQIIAPIGATLPGRFTCTCRTVDQVGRVVVPIFEENRVIKQMVIADLDPGLPIGSPVDVELNIDVKHAIEVRVLVREAGRSETAAIEGPPQPHRPTREEIDDVQRRIDQVLPTFSGSYRARIRARVSELRKDLDESLRYDDEPKAIQRMAELRDVLDQLTYRRGQSLDPPWTRFEQLVKDCLHLAATTAEAVHGNREELSAPIHAQVKYAQQAYEEENQALYRQCWNQLERYAGQLVQLLRERQPEPEPGPPVERPAWLEAKDGVERFRGYLAEVWKKARAKECADSEKRLTEVAAQAKGLSQRSKDDAIGTIREVRRLMARLCKIDQRLDDTQGRRIADDTGLLEGT
jgi:molecular chaperone DnaK